jgi:hypothetical protein
MRSTLTLDDDLAVRLAHLVREGDAAVKATVDAAMRRGLREFLRPQKNKPFRIKPVSLGRELVNIDNVSEAIAFAEGDDYR